MAKKVQINGLKGYARSTSIKLETIYEDEQMWGAKKVSKTSKTSVKRRSRWRWWRWRVRIPRLQIRRILSPSNLLKKLRDAYVRMMLSFEAHGEIGYGAMVLGSHMVHPSVPGRIIHHHDQEEERRFAGIRAQNFRGWGFPWFLNFLVRGLPWFLNFLVLRFSLVLCLWALQDMFWFSEVDIYLFLGNIQWQFFLLECKGEWWPGFNYCPHMLEASGIRNLEHVEGYLNRLSIWSLKSPYSQETRAGLILAF